LLSPFAFNLEIRLLQNKKPTCQFVSGGGLKIPWGSLESLEARPPRARKHTRTAHTAEAKRRVLLGENQHFKSIQEQRGFGNSTGAE
jgi:hypothetical protein